MNNKGGIDDHFECGCSSCASSNVCSKAKLQWGFPHWVGIDEQDLDQVRKKRNRFITDSKDLFAFLETEEFFISPKETLEHSRRSELFIFKTNTV